MRLPERHLADWRPTKDTLHLYFQILGKVRLPTTSPRNHRFLRRFASSLAILPYEDVQASGDPRGTLLAFCESAYEAGARLAGRDLAAFTLTACPSPAELGDLQAAAAGQFGRALPETGATRS